MSLLPKKLAEVLAFASVGLELLERGDAAAVTACGKELMDEMRAKLTAQQLRTQPVADPAKAEKTTAKVRGMMEQYIGNEWDNPTELLEWSGFYFGAAGIHWSLVAALAAKNDDIELSAYADEQAALFAKWLQKGYAQIKEQ